MAMITVALLAMLQSMAVSETAATQNADALSAYAAAKGAAQAEEETFIDAVSDLTNMLQAAQQQIEEGERDDQGTCDKHLVSCSRDTNTNADELKGRIEDGKANLKTIQEGIRVGQKKLSHAEEAVANARNIRDLEAAQFLEASSELRANIDLLNGAVVVNDRVPRTAYFLLRQLSGSMDVSSADRGSIKSFLRVCEEESDDSRPKDKEIHNMLMRISDVLREQLSALEDEEQQGIETFEAFKAAVAEEEDKVEDDMEEKANGFAALDARVDSQRVLLAELEYRADFRGA